MKKFMLTKEMYVCECEQGRNMKCPMRKKIETEYNHGYSFDKRYIKGASTEETFLDCIEDECAWYEPDRKICMPVIDVRLP